MAIWYPIQASLIRNDSRYAALRQKVNIPRRLYALSWPRAIEKCSEKWSQEKNLRTGQQTPFPLRSSAPWFGHIPSWAKIVAEAFPILWGGHHGTLSIPHNRLPFWPFLAQISAKCRRSPADAPPMGHLIFHLHYRGARARAGAGKILGPFPRARNAPTRHLEKITNRERNYPLLAPAIGPIS